MKKNLLLPFFLLSAGFCFAQDTILKRTNEVIIAKIIEVNQTQVKYKRFSYPDGPLYVENQTEIKSITYSNGTKEAFQPAPVVVYTVPPPVVQQSNRIDFWGGKFRYMDRPVGERAAQDIMLNTRDKEITGLVLSARKERGLQFIGFGAIPLAILAGGLLLKAQNLFDYNYTTSGNYAASYNAYQKQRKAYLAFGAVAAAAGLSCVVSSSIFKQRRASHNRQAVRLYNEKY